MQRNNDSSNKLKRLVNKKIPSKQKNLLNSRFIGNFSKTKSITTGNYEAMGI